VRVADIIRESAKAALAGGGNHTDTAHGLVATSHNLTLCLLDRSVGRGTLQSISDWNNGAAVRDRAAPGFFQRTGN